MKRHNDSPARAAMKWLCSMLGVILAVMLSVTLMFQYWLIQTNRASVQDFPLFSLKMPQWNVQELLSDLNSDQIGGTGSGIVNILLIGQDAREGEEVARSDSMILCTYQKKTGKLIMTSFLRDLYVPIPGHGSNRINAAYAQGGMDLLEETLEENFGLHIDGGVEVDFSQFSDIIDLLGGVELELRQDEADMINKETGSTLTEGRQTLTGEQALLYSRIRSLDADGDFSRTDRQRKVLSAMVTVFQGSSIRELLALVETLMPMITTDMSKLQIFALAAELLPQLASLEVSSQSVPSPELCTDETIDGMAVLTADPEAIRALLKSTLEG